MGLRICCPPVFCSQSQLCPAGECQPAFATGCRAAYFAWATASADAHSNFWYTRILLSTGCFKSAHMQSMTAFNINSIMINALLVCAHAALLVHIHAICGYDVTLKTSVEHGIDVLDVLRRHGISHRRGGHQQHGYRGQPDAQHGCS